MKKETSRKVNLSKNAKKILAGVLAASMIMGGTMTAFANNAEPADAGSQGSSLGAEVFEMNADLNNAKTVKDGDSEVLELGAPATKAGVVGVEVDNPFAEDDSLLETWPQAFENNGKAFNGLVNTNSAGEKRVATYGKYLGGIVKKSGKYNFSDTDTKTTFYKKEDAQKVYEEARKWLYDNDMLGASGKAAEIIAEVEASGSGLAYQNEQFKNYLYMLRDVSGEAVTNAAALPSEVVHYAYQGPARGNSGLSEPNTVDGEFSYPLPKWTKGVTVSTWVKVPENAKGSAPIFTFAKNEDNAMTLRTDGTFVFVADEEKTNAGKVNQYAATFLGNTPFNNKGEWIYVTLTVKNDEVNVYYNGVKASEALGSKSQIDKDGKATSKLFNGGFGKKAWGSDEVRTKAILTAEADAYVKLLNNFKDDSTDYTNYTQYSVTTGTLMVDLLADYSTGLFIGGYTDLTIWTWQVFDGMGGYCATPGYSPNNNQGYGAYTGYCEGMRIDGMSFETTPMTQAQASAAYKSAVLSNVDKRIDADKVVSVSNVAIEPEEGDLETNNSQVKEDKEIGDVLQLGAPVTDPGAEVQGVYLDNPFMEKDSLLETWPQAFENYGKTFNGLVYLNGAGEKKVATYGKYLGGFVKKSNKYNFSDTDTKTTFYKKEDAQKVYEEARKWLYDNKVLGASGKAAEIIAEVEASGSGLAYQNEQFKNYLYMLRDVSGEAVTNAAALPSEVVHYTYQGPARGNGGLSEPNTVDGEFSYPLPKWTKGVTVSTWVKVPENAANAAPIFTFANDEANAMTLLTNGMFIFAADGTGNNIGKDNQYAATFLGNTPFNNKGEWVYVTLTVKNDEVNVYYNGEKAEQSLGDKSRIDKDGKATSKLFNGGFGKKAWGSDEVRTKAILTAEADAYVQLLNNLKDSTDYTDYTKYSVKDGTLMVDFLTDYNTAMYVGGYTKTTLKTTQVTAKNEKGSNKKCEDICGTGYGWGAYNESSEGMEVGGISYNFTPLAQSDVRSLYAKALSETKKEPIEPDISSGPAASVEPSAPAASDTPASETPASGTPASETPASGTPASETPASGTPASETPASGTPASETPASGTPASNAPASGAPASQAPAGKLGDVNGDGNIKLNDAQLALKKALNLTTLTPEQEKRADVDENGKVELKDAQQILKFALNLIDKFTKAK